LWIPARHRIATITARRKATTHGIMTKYFALVQVIKAGYLNELCTDRNLLNVRISKFPALVMVMDSTTTPTKIYDAPVHKAYITGIPVKQKNPSAIAKLRTNQVEGISSIILWCRIIATTTMFSRRPTDAKKAKKKLIVINSESVKVC
jgi:hypothetical protein